MPPLPSVLSDEAVAAIEALSRRERDLADFQIPRLRKCTGPITVQQRLAAELRDDLDVYARQVEALEVSVEDQQGERARRELDAVVRTFKESLANLRKEMRSALLTSKRAIDAQNMSNRDELLRSSAVNEKQGGLSASDDALMRANTDVTEALRRTMGLMQGELEKSVLSKQILEESTATLRSASAQHDTLALVMGTSKQLVIALERADWLDRLVIACALAFFILVVLFILKQRFVDRGLRVALWWTRFLPGASSPRAADALSRKAEAGELTAVVTAATAVLSSTIATALSSVASGLADVSASVASEDVVHADVPPAQSVSFVPSPSPADGVGHDEL